MKDETPANSSDNVPDQITAFTIEAISQIDIAALISDLDGRPLRLSSTAAEILNIKAGEPLAPYRDIIDKLVDPSILRNFAPDPLASLRPANIRELELTTSSGRSFKALSYTKRVRLNTGSSDVLEVLISVFHDLTYLEPFFWTIEQSRRNRAIIVLSSSFFGQSILFDGSGKDIIQTYKALEDDFFRSHPLQHQDAMQTDLLTGISRSVEIVDPLIVSSSKIVVNAKTPALLKISKPNFLRIFSHLLLECADFAGPFGLTNIRSNFVYTGGGSGPGLVEIALSAKRKLDIPLRASPLSLHFYRKYLPHYYKIIVPNAGDEVGGKEQHLGVGSDLVDESMSENLTIASHLAKQLDLQVVVKRPEEDSLLISASFRLQETDH
jgi:hypothetical protein